MSARLINVRLDPERLRKALMLREHGLTLSDVVRDAIDERYAALEAAGVARDTDALLADLYARFPDPPNLPPQTYDVHDGAAARGAIRRRLARGRTRR